MYIHVNPNPNGIYVGDCVVRAIAIATGQSWDRIYVMLCLEGFIRKNFGDANDVWGSYLKRIGFRQILLPDSCPNCYTVRDFCRDYTYGTYILATGTHLVSVIDGDYYDAWDSGDEVPTSVWRREKYDW